MDRSGSIWPVMVSAVLLSAAVAAAVAAATLRYGLDDPPRIAGVRLAEITAAYTTRAAAEGRTAEDVRAWGAALEGALDHVAERHGVVLLPARAVAAGAPDLTPQVSGCNPTGRSSVLWEPLRELPVSGENFGYLLWRKRTCCL